MKKQEEALRLPQLATPFKQPRKVEHTVSPEGVKLLLVWNNHSYSVNIPWQILDSLSFREKYLNEYFNLQVCLSLQPLAFCVLLTNFNVTLL